MSHVSYNTHCSPEFEAQEDTSLLYGIHGSTADHLVDIGISTIIQLAMSKAESIPDIPHLQGNKRKYRAILQAQSFLTGKIFQLDQVVLPEGTWIHFDIEDNPLTPIRERHRLPLGFFAT